MTRHDKHDRVAGTVLCTEHLPPLESFDMQVSRLGSNRSEPDAEQVSIPISVLYRLIRLTSSDTALA